MLFVSGALDLKMGGPSGDLTPGFNRRTVYGKVSRFRLDEYLQLFDFPSPHLSAEKRHSTNVPLQRLFFMNSDFVQQQAELLARRTEQEPDQPARLQKLYRILFGRAAAGDELRAGLEFLKAEPLKSYEEHKQDKEKDKKDVPPKSDVPPKPEEKLLPATPWGRYAKILLSSAEFVFIN
jgi:hypothetical protein